MREQSHVFRLSNAVQIQCQLNRPCPTSSSVVAPRASCFILCSATTRSSSLVAQKLGLSRRVCHEEYSNYSETHSDHTLHKEDPRPAYEAS